MTYQLSKYLPFTVLSTWFVTPRSSSEQIAGSIVFYFRSSPNKEEQSFSSLLISCNVFSPSQHVQSITRKETPARHAQTQYLPVSCYVGVSCSIVVHSHEQVIVADVVKECCRVAVGLNGFVDIFTVWCQSHHIIANVVPGHVDVPDVLILLLG